MGQLDSSYLFFPIHSFSHQSAVAQTKKRLPPKQRMLGSSLVNLQRKPRPSSSNRELLWALNTENLYDLISLFASLAFVLSFCNLNLGGGKMKEIALVVLASLL